ncbi:hypothetical protein [Runella sp. SP2]|uniref:hypothetical protein n=1 Tax=Runella sp. SP2 TaxID=2268026 RepID=UPI000F07341D|nr:hypothetical protein [Runella sp. SP2]AYQ35594.1 hypothetical protein DTQ70_27025 [Runella sp. SP2]
MAKTGNLCINKKAKHKQNYSHIQINKTMKSLITTIALSLVGLTTVAEAQPTRKFTQAESQLLATLPTEDANAATFVSVSTMTPQMLIASLPVTDENIETPAPRISGAKLLASLPTVDENPGLPTVKMNFTKLLAALPIADEFTQTTVLIDSPLNVDTKSQATAVRLSEE